jgi:hypothetical protein
MAVVAAVVVAAVVAAAAAAVVVAEEEVVVVVVAVAEVAVAVEPTTMMTNQTVTFYSFLIVGFISIVNTFDEKKFRRKSLKNSPRWIQQQLLPPDFPRVFYHETCWVESSQDFFAAGNLPKLSLFEMSQIDLALVI